MKKLDEALQYLDPLPQSLKELGFVDSLKIEHLEDFSKITITNNLSKIWIYLLVSENLGLFGVFFNRNDSDGWEISQYYSKIKNNQRYEDLFCGTDVSTFIQNLILVLETDFFQVVQGKEWPTIPNDLFGALN